MLLLSLMMLTRVTSTTLKCNPSTCASNWKGDYYCDKNCMTSFCNFDTPESVDSTEEKEKSDCFQICVYNYGCPEDKLGDGICDSSCNHDVCGFDWGDCGYCASGCLEAELGGSKCDSSCNTNLCIKDLNVCAECNTGCTNAKLIDTVCDEECNTALCNYDNGVCETTTNLCAPDCYSYMINNGACDEPCKNEDCEYDGNDCLCNPSCFDELLGDGTCDDPCDVPDCDWDDGDCGGCATGCYNVMLTNGECDEECNNSNCGWDNLACGCTISCTFDMLGSCDSNCLVHQCFYDEFIGESDVYPWCEDDSLKLNAVRNNLILKDFNLANEAKVCNSTGVLCFPSEPVAMPACLTECPDEDSCEYEFKECTSATPCFPGCLTCFGTEDDECLSCDIDKSLFFTSCVDECPLGYIAEIYGFMSTVVCIPEIDISTESSPYLYFVKDSANTGTGAADDPFGSLSIALASIFAKYNVILLSGSTEFKLNKVPENYILGENLSSAFTPLNRIGHYEPYIVIEPESDGPVTLKFEDYEDYMTFNVKGHLVLNNVIIDGSVLEDTCAEEDYCNYCPYISVEDGYHTTDKGEHIEEDEYYSGCSSYHDIDLFVVEDGATLTITDTMVQNMRMELNSLIHSGVANVELNNVNFTNIRVKSDSESAVVVFSDCGEASFCGNFTYTDGKVRLLNNGYEYIDDVDLRGFFYSQEMHDITMSDLEFECILLFLSSGTTISRAALFHMKHFHKLVLKDSIFAVNLLRDGIFHIDAEDLEYTYTVNAENQIQELLYDHIDFSNIQVQSCYFENYGLIEAKYRSSLQNIKMDSIIAKENTVVSGPFISIFNNMMLEEYKESNTIPTDIDGTRISAYFTKRTATFSNFDFQENQFSGNGIFDLNKLANINISNANIQRNTPISSPFNNFFLPRLTADGTAYMSETIDSSPSIACTYYAYIVSSYNLIIENTEHMYNECIGSSPAFYIYDQQKMSINNTKCKFNTGESTTSVCLELNGAWEFTINDSYFSDNTLVTGSAVITATGPIGQSLAISDTEISRNSGIGLSSHSPVTNITNVKFEDNTNGSTNGVAIYYTMLAATNCSLDINDSAFKRNRASTGNGAGVKIDLTTSGNYYMKLNVANSIFEANHANTYASVLFIYSNILLDSDSLISNSIFRSNTVESKGNIYLTYLDGDLTFSNCTFESNTAKSGTGAGAAMMIASNDLARVNIHDSTFTSNSGTNIIYLDDNSLKNRISTRDCTFSSNSGAAIQLNYGGWVDSSSTFTQNTGDLSGSFILENESTATLVGTVFSTNTGDQGGAGILRSESSLVTSGVSFRGNTADIGGALYVEQNSQITIGTSTFTENTARQGSAIFLLGCADSDSSINSSHLYNNNAQENAVIAATMAQISIIDSTVYDNTASDGTPGVSFAMSTGTITNSEFYSQNGTIGIYVYATTSSTVSVSGSSFTDSQCTGSGGAIYVIHSDITIDNCRFSNLTASIAGAILVYSESSLSLKNSNFEEIKADISGGIIESFECHMTVENSVFKTFEEGALVCDKLYSLSVKNSEFSDGVSDQGPGIICTRCFTVSIEDSRFHDLTADKGGALFLTTQKDLEISSVYLVKNSTFSTNSALDGGAIYTDNIKLSIEDSVFTTNSAMDDVFNENIEIVESGRGGAMWMVCNDFTSCAFTITNTQFTDNRATYNGGGIAWNSIEPTFTSCSFSGNSAFYGNDISSFATQVYTVDSSGNIIDESRRSLNTGSLSGVASGQYAGSLAVALVDHYGNIVTTDNVSSGSISSSDTSTAVSGSTKVTASRGIYNFTEFIISASPGSTASISVESDAINIQQNGTENKIAIVVNMRECQLGEARVGVECVYCETGLYSINMEDTDCNTCPSGAVCYGGLDIVPKAGHWRSNMYSEVFWTCPNTAACSGGERNSTGEISHTGRCAAGYKGNMCQSCESGYSRTSANNCGACPSDPAENVLKLLGISILVIIIASVMVRAALNSAYKPKAMHSVYLKIFVNYLQLVTLTATFDLEWPNLVLELFSIHETAGSATDQIFSFDCFLGEEEDQQEGVYFDKIVIMSFIPLMLALAALIVWTCICLYKRTWKYMKDEFVATIVILLFLIHPTIIKVMFSSMNCKEIETAEYWLVDSMDIRCWDSTHTYYVLFVAIPSIFVWGIGLPSVCLYILYKKRKRLDKINVRKQFGFVFNGYTKKGFYWEFVILYRKILIICCSVFLANISVSVQALTVMILLLISLYMQKKHEPYSEPPLNQMEVRSILVSAVTIYCGLYYLTGDLDEVAKLMFFVIIVGINIYFLYVWSVKMFGAGVEFLGQKVPFIRRLCVKKVQDGFADEIFRVQENIPHVKGKGNEKYYTILGNLGKEQKKPRDVRIHPDTTMHDFYLKYMRKRYYERLDGLHEIETHKKPLDDTIRLGGASVFENTVL